MQSDRGAWIDFDNTSVAFQDQSNYSLRQAYVLFKVMNNPTLVNLPSIWLIRVAIRLPVKGIIKTIYRHFVGGCLLRIVQRRLTVAQRNVQSILDCAQKENLMTYLMLPVGGHQNHRICQKSCYCTIQCIQDCRDRAT